MNKAKLFFLPNVSDEGDLPRKPGVYYVTALWHVYYVGRSTNLYLRWRDHHRYEQWTCLCPFGRIHYQTLPAKDLAVREKEAIEHFQGIGEANWNYTTTQASVISRWLLRLKMAAFAILVGSFVITLLYQLSFNK